MLEQQGTNGQSCFVERTEWEREDYRNDLYTPLCYDAAGAKAQMKVWFDVADLRAKGVSPSDLRREIDKRFREGTYQAPERADFSYMTAPVMRAYTSPNPSDKTIATMSMPHIMYYAPNVSNADIGGVQPLSPYPFIAHQGPHGYMMQFLGETERKKIVGDEKILLQALCSYREFLCLGSDANKAAHPYYH